MHKSEIALQFNLILIYIFYYRQLFGNKLRSIDDYAFLGAGMTGKLYV